MSSKNDYELKLETLKSIPHDQVNTLTNIPVEVYIQEALNLYRWSQNDILVLTGKGLAEQLVLDLPVRAGALREAQSIWMKMWNARQEGQKAWDIQASIAIGLRETLIQEFRFAFRHEGALLRRIAVISESRTQAALSQDLNDLSVIGASQPELLAAIHFDMQLITTALQTAASIGVLLATARKEAIFGNTAKNIRDRAYTHLKAAVDEIYAYGRFVFRKDPKRRAGYTSRYLAASRLARRARVVEQQKAA